MKVLKVKHTKKKVCQNCWYFMMGKCYNCDSPSDIRDKNPDDVCDGGSDEFKDDCVPILVAPSFNFDDDEKEYIEMVREATKEYKEDMKELFKKRTRRERL